MEKNQVELKNTLSKIKNSLDEFNSRLETAENNKLQDKLGVI